MNDIVIFVVGLGVMGIVMGSAFVALMATDYPDGPKAYNNPTLTKSEIDHPVNSKLLQH